VGRRRSIWVGREEHQGVRAQPRKDLKPPPHWRLEAVAATPRPHSLTMSADRRLAVFVEAGETSDIFAVHLAGGPVERLTAARPPVSYWDDTVPRLSPDGARVAYGQEGHVWLVPTAGGPPRRLTEGGSPVWVDDERLVIAVEHSEDDSTRLAIVDLDDPWPQRLAREHGSLERHGDEGEAVVSPDGTEVAYTFRPRGDLNRSEILVAGLEDGAVRALTGTPRMHDLEPAWSPDGRTIAYRSERPGYYELFLVGRDGDGDRRLTSAGATHFDFEWHPDGSRLVAVRVQRNRSELVTVDAATGDTTVVAEGGWWSTPHWGPRDEVVAAYEDHATPPEIRIAGAERALYAPAPRAVRKAPHARLEDVSFPSLDGLEIPAFLLRPPDASPERPVAAVVYPHGGPTDAYTDDWHGHAQYFVDMGYAWLAVNYRGSSGYGRDFERANHGVWGVDDTKDCLAAADYLRTLDWVDGDRLAIYGASYGSYMALLAVTDDPEHRFRCAATLYGDCDIVTSWAQGDREGVQDLERMMGPPSAAREAYRAGSPYHRLVNIEVPLLIAHGELDKRVSPKQSEQLVAELRRLGKTFEYVTYPTEGHGLLRAGPHIDFYRRLERFLNWNLM
jgi:dipeptidyl aminopeptidase/acylaminoacyl peptidase